MQVGERTSQNQPELYNEFIQAQREAYKHQLPTTGIDVRLFAEKIGELLAASKEELSKLDFRVQLGTESEAAKIWTDPSGNGLFGDSLSLVQYLS
jgi:hypothetical protein